MWEAPRAVRDESELLGAYASGARNFAGTQLSGADLRDANLTEVVLDRAQLGGADFAGATLIEGSFSQARLTRSILRGAKLWAANLSNANLVGADLSGATLVSANLKQSDLREAKLNGANLSGANLFKANLLGAQLVGTDLGRANLPGANLAGSMAMEADLTAARAWQCNLSDADLRNARLAGASLIGARLDRADLTGAALAGADLSDCSLVGARLDAPADGVATATRCRIDAATYIRSDWDPYTLAAWIDAGAIIVDPDHLPQAAHDHLATRGEGLTLYLNSPLEPFDRFVVDALIFGVLGTASTARTVEVVALETRGIIRILDDLQANLAALGDVIDRGGWQDPGAMAIETLFDVPQIASAAQRFRARLSRIELRGIRGAAPPPTPLPEETDLPEFPGEHTRVDTGIDELDDRPLTTLRVWSGPGK